MAILKGHVNHVLILILVGSIIVLTYFIADNGAIFEDYIRNSGFTTRNMTENLNTDVTEYTTKVKKINNSKYCESCYKGVPNLIIQYGEPRTATTLQFQILCLMMAMLHEDEKDSVGCFFRKMNTHHKYKVIKMHSISITSHVIKPGSWVFMTSRGELPQQKRDQMNEMKKKHIDIPYIADVNLVAKRSHFIAYEYQNIFGLTDDQIKQVVEYLRYWEIIRVCCGIQMSADWRNHLAPKKNYQFHHDVHSPTYPACEMYDISKVEALLLNTHVVKTFYNTSPLNSVIGKPSLVDGFLDGSYCERCSAKISKYKLKFNAKCT